MKQYNTPRKIATFCLMLSGILLILGGSLAFYSYMVTSNGYVSIQTEGLTFRYKEGTNHISLSNAMPVDDWEGMHNDNYFEFEITSNNPMDMSILYYITARKTENSDDIDDAIKVGIMEVENAQHDIYFPYGFYGNFEAIYLDEYLDDDAYFIKVYNKGDIINSDTYTILNTYPDDRFESEDECLNSEIYQEIENDDAIPICVATDSGYSIQMTYNIYDSEEECQNSIEDSNFESCILKYHSGETYPYDVYKSKNWNWIDNLPTEAECEEYISNNPDEVPTDAQCGLYFHAGDTINENVLYKGNYSNLGDYKHNSIDLSNYTEKLLYKSSIDAQTNDYKKVYRIHMWLDYDADFTQAKYSNAKFGLTFNVYSKTKKSDSNLAPGLYDEDNELIVTWGELVNDYGLNVESTTSDTYWSNTEQRFIYRTPSTFGYIMEHNPGLATGTKLVIGNDVTRIGSCAFIGTNLTEIILPDTITEILYEAFYESKLKSIVIPASVESMGNEVFSYCFSLTNVVFEDNSKLQQIPYKTFFDCYKLGSVTLANGLEKIGVQAFEDSKNLYSIQLPSTVTEIDDRAFADCLYLEAVTLEDNSQLTTIGTNVFNNTRWYDRLSNNGKIDIYLNDVLIRNTDSCYHNSCGTVIK